jgi:hypothetical protein
MTLFRSKLSACVFDKPMKDSISVHHLLLKQCLAKETCCGSTALSRFFLKRVPHVGSRISFERCNDISGSSRTHKLRDNKS